MTTHTTPKHIFETAHAPKTMPAPGIPVSEQNQTHMTKKLTKMQIVKAARKAELPVGWYTGPWFDDYGNLQSSMPECLEIFVDLVRKIK